MILIVPIKFHVSLYMVQGYESFATKSTVWLSCVSFGSSWYGFSPSWLFMCLLRWLHEMKPLPQRTKLYGFSLTWLFMCLFIWFVKMNFVTQSIAIWIIPSMTIHLPFYGIPKDKFLATQITVICILTSTRRYSPLRGLYFGKKNSFLCCLGLL